MARVSEVAEDIYQIHPELNFMFSLSYLILGEKPTLIDPGSTAQSKVVLQTLEEELKVDLDSLKYVIPTHLHIDHGGGAGYVARELPQTQVVVNERHARHLIDPAMLIDANKQTFGDNFADKFGNILSVPESQVLSVSEGDRIDIGGRTLEVLYTRGHANHHFCLYDDNCHGLFCGDTLGMYYPEEDGVVIICPEGFDLDLSIETIDRLRKLDPKLLFYAHEGVGRAPATLMTRAVQEIKDCGEIVLEALKIGENSKQIEQRLNEYFTNNVSAKLNYERMYLDLTVAGYKRYFKKIGLYS
ncbi:MAG: MBL fold metallo-hydrolase [Chloroflexi bacterium]|jgi:glyoxylase-like metal-dependent hydrolase (beta-lactamase superfamily II)|nr:MBL fold metallo-hydrolase [Chloroflexota bacterium]